MNDELKPCPFCGGTNIHESICWITYTSCVRCRPCGINTGYIRGDRNKGTKWLRGGSEARRLWNRRATMPEKIKHCPFCGSHAKLEYEGKEFSDGENWLHVVCSNCGGSSGYYMSAESARRAWNMRNDSYKP